MDQNSGGVGPAVRRGVGAGVGAWLGLGVGAGVGWRVGRGVGAEQNVAPSRGLLVRPAGHASQRALSALAENRPSPQRKHTALGASAPTSNVAIPWLVPGGHEPLGSTRRQPTANNKRRRIAFGVSVVGAGVVGRERSDLVTTVVLHPIETCRTRRFDDVTATGAHDPGGPVWHGGAALGLLAGAKPGQASRCVRRARRLPLSLPSASSSPPPAPPLAHPSLTPHHRAHPAPPSCRRRAHALHCPHHHHPAPLRRAARQSWTCTRSGAGPAR